MRYWYLIPAGIVGIVAGLAFAECVISITEWYDGRKHKLAAYRESESRNQNL